MKSYYQILEVSETASHDEIKKQYRFLSQAWHPDKFPTSEQKRKSEEKIKEINEAYRILGNPAKRKKYDNKINAAKSSRSNPRDTQPKNTDSKNYYKSQNPAKSNANISSQTRKFPESWILIGAVTIIICTIFGSFLLFNKPQSQEANNPTTIVENIASTSTKIILPTNTEFTIPTPTLSKMDSNKQMDDMVLIESGSFIMGRNDGAANESPEHSVYLDSYYIDKYEATNSMYYLCVSAGVCQPPTHFDIFSSPSYFGNLEFDTYPVIYVNWDMANSFCQWRNARLPTEAEWEKAARGTNHQIYPWGNDFSENRANFCDKNCPNDWANQNFNDGYAGTSPVGSFPLGQSSFGVFDMVGNVYEWVNDWYSENYYSQSPQNNPRGPESGKDRVIRGGAWGDVLATNTISRASFAPISSHEFIGFRCARSVNE